MLASGVRALAGGSVRAGRIDRREAKDPTVTFHTNCDRNSRLPSMASQSIIAARVAALVASFEPRAARPTDNVYWSDRVIRRRGLITAPLHEKEKHDPEVRTLPYPSAAGPVYRQMKVGDTQAEAVVEGPPTAGHKYKKS